VTTAGSRAEAAYPGAGNIEYPTVSATYAAAGGGEITASATWTGTPTMQLSISCPDGIRATRSGASGLSVTVDDGAGGGTSCEVTLAMPPDVAATVSYTLDVDPPPGA
jgi:hypothetical protein